MKLVARIFVLLALPAVVFAAEAVSVKELLKDAKNYDKKEVTVSGAVLEFKQRTSRVGNKYFTFKLKEGDQTINVYSQGAFDGELKDEAKVEVTGIYTVEKKLGDLVFKNEIDCTKKEGKKFGVKQIK